jgi:hypothetical protein
MQKKISYKKFYKLNLLDSFISISNKILLHANILRADFHTIKLIAILFTFTLLLFSSGCYFPTASSKVQYIYDQFGLNFPMHTKVYLVHNIWHKNPMDISFFNYQQGKIIPFGTEVEFVEAYPNYVVFKAANNKIEYKITNVPGISMLSNNDLFYQIFTPVNPDIKTINMPKETIAKLKQGKIEVGMTREEVLLALGPPPLSMTPPGTKVTWIYFLNNTLKTTHLVFKDNKVSYIFNN